MGPLLPTLALFGGLAYLDRAKKEKLVRESVGRPPMWTAEAASAIAETVLGVRVIRAEVRPLILASLAALALQPVELDGAPGPVFKTAPLEPNAIRAAEFLSGVHERGGVVFVSLTCALIGADDGDKVVCVAKRGTERVANPLSHFALLWPTETLIAAASRAARKADPVPEEESDPRGTAEGERRPADATVAGGPGGSNAASEQAPPNPCTPPPAAPLNGAAAHVAPAATPKEETAHG